MEFDPRDDAEISEGLRSRLRRYRNYSSAGLGDESAGLMISYLISEVFRRAGNAVEATLSVSDFQALLMADGDTIARAMGRRDWGVVVGQLRRRPMLRRADLLDLIHSALPLKAKDVGCLKMHAHGNVWHRENQPRCWLPAGPS